MFDPPKVFRALQRGRACKIDPTKGWDPWPVMERPLEDVRAEYGIPPLEQRRAAGVARARHAAANPIRRFGGSLNLNLHFHAIIADGVFVTEDETPKAIPEYG